jgi:hypothetical protein
MYAGLKKENAELRAELEAKNEQISIYRDNAERISNLDAKLSAVMKGLEASEKRSEQAEKLFNRLLRRASLVLIWMDRLNDKMENWRKAEPNNAVSLGITTKEIRGWKMKFQRMLIDGLPKTAEDGAWNTEVDKPLLDSPAEAAAPTKDTNE